MIFSPLRISEVGKYHFSGFKKNHPNPLIICIGAQNTLLHSHSHLDGQQSERGIKKKTHHCGYHQTSIEGSPTRVASELMLGSRL
jgi:hypothetical protein